MPRCSLDPSEGEDAFCEAEPRPAKQGLNISVADIAQSGAEATNKPQCHAGTRVPVWAGGVKLERFRDENTKIIFI